MIDIFEKYEKIYNAKTKAYFEEVISSYNNKNYRAAIVMLYSIVIYDIMSKVKELDEIYNQEWARKIIKEINKLRTESPKSSEWEKTLIEKISQQRDFLSLSIVEEINHLREIRNQCAHPAIDNNDELFSPSRYEADALLSRMLDEILTIPAMFTNKITDYITEQISKIAGYSQFKWKDRIVLSKTFNSYFIRMNDQVFIKVFKDMWKLTFLVINDDCDKNRFANVIFIDIMLKERHALLLDELKNEKEYFNKLSNDTNIIKFLCLLIYRNNFLLNFMNDYTKSLIKSKKFETEDIQLFAWFAFDSLQEYLDNLKSNTHLHSYSDFIIDNYKANPAFEQSKELYRKTLIDIYLNSPDFNSADRNFDNLIYPIYKDFTKEEVLYLISSSEEKPQLTRRYGYMGGLRRSRLLDLVDYVEISPEDIAKFKKFNEFYNYKDTNDVNVNTEINDDDLPF